MKSHQTQPRQEKLAKRQWITLISRKIFITKIFSIFHTMIFYAIWSGLVLGVWVSHCFTKSWVMVRSEYEPCLLNWIILAHFCTFFYLRFSKSPAFLSLTFWPGKPELGTTVSGLSTGSSDSAIMLILLEKIWKTSANTLFGLFLQNLTADPHVNNICWWFEM